MRVRGTPYTLTMPPKDPPTVAELLTPEQREEFLGSLREGIPHGLAARAVGHTGTKLRAARKRDPEFRAEVEAAIAEGDQHYEDRLRAEARVRALGGSDRLLEVELATHAAGYEHLRRNRLEVEGMLRHGIALPDGWLESAPDGLLEWLATLDADVVDGEAVELPSTNGHGELNP